MNESCANSTAHAAAPVVANALEGQRSGPLWLVWLALFACFTILYGLTANRGVQWQDSGFHILRALEGEVVNPLGLALSHPLHHYLARLAIAMGLFPPGFAATLISAVAGALAVANVFGCARALTGRIGPALFAGVSLGLANTFWHLATLTESYTLAAALLAAECWCLVEYLKNGRHGALVAAGFLNGLGVSNHLLALLTTPVVGCVVVHAALRRDVRRRTAIAALVVWLAGAALYGALVGGEILASGEVFRTLRSALFGHTYADEVLNLRLISQGTWISLGFVVLSFPNALLPAAAMGMVSDRRRAGMRSARRALTAGVVLHALFVLRYPVPDQHYFLLPLFTLLCIFGGLGAEFFVSRLGARGRRRSVAIAAALLLVTPIFYAFWLPAARRLDVLKDAERHKPYRDDYVAAFVPWCVVERSAERMASRALELAEDRGLVLVEDRMGMFAVQAKALMTGSGAVVRMAPEVDAATLGRMVHEGRPVVLVPSRKDSPRTPPAVGQWRRVDDLYVLAVEAPKEPAENPTTGGGVPSPDGG